MVGAHPVRDVQGDFPARRMIDGVQGVDPARKARLIKVLDVDPEWRMHRVSDGQRRRVQLMLGLLKPFQVGRVPAASLACCIWKGFGIRLQSR